MKTHRISLFVLSLLANIACAQTPAMKSAAWMSQSTACTGVDQLMQFDRYGNWNTLTASPGAGPWNSANASVRIVCVAHEVLGAQEDAYAVAGHSGPNGDHVTPFLIGTGTQCARYDTTPVVFLTGEYFDVHAACSRGSHRIMLQIWYTQP